MQAHRCPGLSFNPPGSLAITSTKKYHHTSCSALFQLRGTTNIRTKRFTLGGTPIYWYSGIARPFARQPVSHSSGRHTSSLATCPSCGHAITSSPRHKLIVLNWEDFFTLVQKRARVCRNVRACLEDFIHSKARTQPHVLRGGVESINPGISLQRHAMDSTISSFAFGSVISWLVSSFQLVPGGLPMLACHTSICQYAYADHFDYISPKQG